MFCSVFQYDHVGRMGLARRVALGDKIKNAISDLVGKYEGEEFLLDDLYVDRTNIL
jgi:hypothetical protein